LDGLVAASGACYGAGSKGILVASSRFLKKAAQKLLFLWACGSETSTAQFNKVFLLLFVHKKKPS
jgi:hypothetical protein